MGNNLDKLGSHLDKFPNVVTEMGAVLAELGRQPIRARKFLIDGHKVIIVQNFRGREMSHKDRGQERLESIAEELSDVSRIELGAESTRTLFKGNGKQVVGIGIYQQSDANTIAVANLSLIHI